MPWWSWIVIWVALVAVSLLYVGALGLWLWRRFAATRQELAHASAALDARRDYSDTGATVDESTTSATVSEPKIAGVAIFASPEQMKDDYFGAKAKRKSVRRARRVALRTQRRQLQKLSDVELSTLP
ncbi:MAG: hypothetical protein HIU81_07855 [Acidobacteria bacterium]|nr:hypothetical protein [Acidobacteriota bacterium]